jgi:ArsR family transcriptional regulator, arsenate/arsenite/antimonite-responsive transcriptional repressor
MAANAQLRYTEGIAMNRADVEKVSKALADATRLMIFEAIASRKHMNCRDIASLQGVTPATVSHHLKTLHDAGLITCRRNGQSIYSTTVPATLKAYTLSLGKMGRGKRKKRTKRGR